ncbi:MAG TPA: nucleotidyltransferase family protein [bacterium]|nr:nucleotidyltransferase family protein [bacterium]
MKAGISDSRGPTVAETVNQHHVARRDARAILKRAYTIASERDNKARNHACRILLAACRWITDPTRGPTAPPEDELTTQWLAALGRKHGLLPTLYAYLSSEVRSSLRDSLAGDYKATKQVNLDALSELEAIAVAASKAGVPVVALKGPSLAFTLYGDPALRPFADLDLLISSDDFERAETILTTLGYAPPPGLLPSRFYLKHHIHLPYLATGKTKIELHWGLTHQFRPWRIPVDEVMSRATVRSLGGVESPCLCDEDHLIYLCTHLEEHGYYSRFAEGVPDEAIVANPDVNNRLIWLLDIALMLTQVGEELDWEATVDRARRWRVGGHVKSAMHLSQRLLGARAPAWVVKQLPGLRSFRFERAVAKYIALWPQHHTLYGATGPMRVHQFLLSRVFRMHPTLQFRPSRVFDLMRYIFSEGAVGSGGNGEPGWRRRAVLGAPFRLTRLLNMAMSIIAFYAKHKVLKIPRRGGDA